SVLTSVLRSAHASVLTSVPQYQLSHTEVRKTELRKSPTGSNSREAALSDQQRFGHADLGCERNVAMTEEADHDGDDQHQSAREIGSAAVIAGVPAEKADDERKRSGGQNHAARINSKATDPLAKIVAFGLEYEPLITKE